MKFEDRLNEDLSVYLGGAAVLEGRLKGDPVYEIRTEVHSFPLELATNYNLFNVLTLFAGTGMGLNFGKSRGKGDLEARGFNPLTCVSGACTRLELSEVEVIGNLNGRKNVYRITGRAFSSLN